MSREFRIIFPSGEMCKPIHAQRLAPQIPMPLTKGGIECLQICHRSVICSRQSWPSEMSGWSPESSHPAGCVSC